MSLQNGLKNTKGWLTGALLGATLATSAQAATPSEPITPWDDKIEYVQNLEDAKAFSSENCPTTYAVTNVDKDSKGFEDLSRFIAKSEPEKTLIHVEDSGREPYVGLQLCGAESAEKYEIDPNHVVDIKEHDRDAIYWGIDERRRNSRSVDTLLSFDSEAARYKESSARGIAKRFTVAVIDDLLEIYQQRKASRSEPVIVAANTLE